MRFSKVWILPLVGSSVGFTSTQYYVRGHPNNKDITARRLRVEPVNTEERNGGPEAFVKAIGVLPQDVATLTKATAHTATDVEKIVSDQQAELIKQTLWKEFQQQKWLPEFDRLDQADIMPIFLAFVQEDQRRTMMLEEWNKWRSHTGKNEAQAQGTAAFKSALVDTTAKTKQLIPDEQLLPDKTARGVMPLLWNKFKEQMQLQRLPSFNDFDPILQAYLKPKLLTFIHEDQNRKWLFKEWIKWKNKASNNGAPAPDIFSAFLPDTTHELVAAEKIISDKTAENIKAILWNEFQQKHGLEFDHKASIEDLDIVSQEKVKTRFSKFVNEDGDRRKIYEEWLKWQKDTERKNALAQNPRALKRPKYVVTTHPPKPEVSEVAAAEIWRSLWKKFLQQHAEISPRTSSFDQLDLASQYSLKPKFLKFVYEDKDRAKMFEKWLERNKAWVPDVVAFKHAMSPTG